MDKVREVADHIVQFHNDWYAGIHNDDVTAVRKRYMKLVPNMSFSDAAHQAKVEFVEGLIRDLIQPGSQDS